MTTSRDEAQSLSIAPDGINEETFRQVLEVQVQDIRNRTEELQLRHRELEYNSSHAQDILHAQERDRDAARVHIRKVRYANLIFASLATTLVAAIVVVAMMMDKDALAADLLKITISLVAGAVGGYGFARSRRYDADDE